QKRRNGRLTVPTRGRANAPICLALVLDISAAVLRVVGLGGAGGAGLFLAEADGFDLRVADAQPGHHAAHGVGTAVAQGQLVFGPAASGSVALDLDTLLLVGSQVAGVGLDQATVLVGHRVAVEVKVHRTLLRQDALRVERVHDLARGGALARAGGAGLPGLVVQRDGAASGQGGSQGGNGEAFGNAHLHDCSFSKEGHTRLSGKWSPSRLTYFPIQYRERLPHATIAGHASQYAAAVLDRGVKYLHAVRREAWGLVVTTVGQQGVRAGGKLE